MPHRLPSWTRAWTYVLALGIGWAVTKQVQMRRAVADGGPDAPLARGSGRPQTVLSDPKQRLEQMLAKVKAKESSADKSKREERELRLRIAQRRKSLPREADVALAAKLALAKRAEIPPDETPEAARERKARMAVVYLRWLESDSAAALEYLGEPYFESYDAPKAGLQEALQLWAAEQPREEMLALANRTKWGSADELLKGVVRHIGEEADTGSVAWVISKFGGQAGEDGGRINLTVLTRWQRELVDSWPEQKLAELIPEALQWEDNSMVLMTLYRMSPRDVCRHLRQLLDSAEGNAKLQMGRASEALSGLIYRNTDMPLEQRLALVAELAALPFPYSSKLDDWSSKRPGAAAEVLSVEWKTIENGGTQKVIEDAFHSGTMNAREAEQALMEAMPGSTALDPDATRKAVDRWLMERDAARALALYDHLPVEERYRTAMDTISRRHSELTPAALLAFHEALPFNPEFGTVAERAKMWDSMIASHDGDACREWIEKMPKGLNRDLALSALVKVIAEKDPHAAAAVKARISNPDALK